MKNMMCVLTLLVLLAVIGAISMPTLAESWQTRYGTRKLEFGAENVYVGNLQVDLNAAGCSVSLTGKYDRDTRIAVRNFQSQQGLAVNGIFDDIDKITLWNLIN